MLPGGVTLKELTEEEVADRAGALQRAEKIFSHMTNADITKAFKAYQAIFAEREREIFLSSHVHGRRPRTLMDKWERPKCPDCGSNMLFRVVPENNAGTKTQLVCESPKCDTVLNSKNDLNCWMNNLRIKKNGNEGSAAGPGKGE
jgi:hypothetical protein